MGRGLMVVGLALLVLGALVTYAPGAVSWFGRLPGDIRIERENTFVFIPLTSMLIVSVVVSLVAHLLRR